MSNKDRLELAAALLDLIDQHRRRTGDPKFGSEIERFILEREWHDLEKEFLKHPGLFEPQLDRVRRRRAAGSL